ncbi:amidase [Deinococcus irradiatisoli]|nr:amidase [Deinococcus irradiatisoli]
MPSALLRCAARELARLIASGEVSSAEVVELHLEQLEALKPLNALAYTDPAAVRREARQRDRQRAAGEALGPLHGVPFTVKDWLDVAGWPCAGAELKFRHRRPDQDASAVGRLRAAGGVVLGKTAVLAESEVYGRVHHPHDPRLSPGGSSSGEAVLIAACGSPLGLGSDSGGSIRQPAAYCGVAGLKPTPGRVPLTGHFPRINPLADPRTVIGPLARRVADLGLALKLIMGEDGHDPSAVPATLGDIPAPIEGLRVAYHHTLPDTAVDPQIVQAVRWAAQTLANAGCHVREEAPPGQTEAMRLTRQYWARPESSSWDEWQPDGAVSSLSADEVERHLFDWDVYRRRLLAFMHSADVLLLPVAENLAAPHGREGGVDFTAPYSLAGLPAVTVPVGRSPEGLPIGVQVVARAWREDVALGAAQVLEDAYAGAGSG